MKETSWTDINGKEIKWNSEIAYIKRINGEFCLLTGKIYRSDEKTFRVKGCGGNHLVIWELESQRVVSLSEKHPCDGYVLDARLNPVNIGDEVYYIDPSESDEKQVSILKGTVTDIKNKTVVIDECIERKSFNVVVC